MLDTYDEFFGHTPTASTLRPPRKRPRKHSPLKDQITYCGLTQPLGVWIQESRISPRTVIDRIKNQNLSPVEALITPNRAGRRLHPVTPGQLDEERKRRQRERSGVRSVQSGPHGDPVHVAGIMAYGHKVLLGTCPTLGEAVLAFNTAVDLLPEEYAISDKINEEMPLDSAAADKIRRAVIDRLRSEGLLPEEEVEFARAEECKE